LSEEAFGLAGGALFLLSWALQAWESRRIGRPIVTLKFFLIRSVGCVLLIIESVSIESLSLFIIAAGTLALNFYNIYLFKRTSAKDVSSE
jgi:lipid-A-disaccharide synthase-like uncharacterized protein